MNPKPFLYAVVLCFFLLIPGLFWVMGGFEGLEGLFEESDLDKLEETGVCVKCDLSGANLGGADLSTANLTRATLKLATLTGSDLRGANLTGTIFCGTKMPDESINDSGC